MEIEKQIAWIKIGLVWTAVLWVINGALLIWSFPYLKMELVAVFAFSSLFWIIFLIIYVEMMIYERNKSRA